MDNNKVKQRQGIIEFGSSDGAVLYSVQPFKVYCGREVEIEGLSLVKVNLETDEIETKTVSLQKNGQWITKQTWLEARAKLGNQKAFELMSKFAKPEE
jgi:hypothetical protein